MASVLVMCLLLFLLFLHTQGQLEKISPGSTLSPNTNRSSWLSPSGHFAFGFYQQDNGFAVGIWLVDKPDITVVWTANRDDPPVPLNSTFDFTEDGLLLRTAQGHEKTIVRLREQPASASMQDSGNFIIYDNESQVIWESFDSPTDTILGGQSIDSQLMASRSTSDRSRGRFYLSLNYYQLGAFPVNHTGILEECYWNVPIMSTGYSLRLNLSLSGTLQLTRGSKTLQAIANSSYYAMSKTVIYRATLDSDGILRLYSHRFDINGNSNVTIEWSALINQCEVKGFCGFNSFCSSDSNKTDCYCFPGFDFIDPEEKFRGCNRNFTDEEGCQRKEPALIYNVTNLEKTKLGGLAYHKQSMPKENCSVSCLDDCHCGGALYSNGTCNKFKLPLMFGMKDEFESDTVFIKWNSGNLNPEFPPFPNKRAEVSENKKKLITKLVVSLGFIMFFCFLIAISSFLVYKLRDNRYKRLPGNSNLGLTQEFTLRSFSYIELEHATDGFKEELGRGWFGAAYKGSIYEGNKMIAVKRLENPLDEAERMFRAEMVAVRQTHHRNLVRLLGFCLESSRKLLVYEYMSKGPLADLLFNVERHPPWKERVRIALDVARGIHYLHEECEVQIIHCDIKPRNILIDDSGTAKISDLGFAKLLMPNQTATDYGFKGSRGYIAPESIKNGSITVKSDVYSFGVVLLEIICCRSNMEVNVSMADEVLLSTWVFNCFVSQELNRLVALEEVNMKTLERMVKVGLLCIQDEPNLRPSMKNVILMLEGTMDILVPPRPGPLVNT